MNKFDVIIIGGGAAGLCSAVLLKRKLPQLHILIIEANDRVGKKLIVTGNGRCNITNRYLSPASYFGKHSEFCETALEKYGFSFTEEFFGSLGIPFTEGDDGKMYPYSLKASSVVDALRMEANTLHVDILCGSKAERITYLNNEYAVTVNGDIYNAKNIIVATGGLAGGEKLGCNTGGYKLLTDLGLTLVAPKPSIVQLKTETEKIKALSGIKMNSQVTLFADNKKVRSETGELLFTKYGISGPPVMQISRGVHLSKNITVKINFLPEYKYSELVDFLINRIKLLKSRSCEFFFTGMLPKMLGLTILKLSGINPSDSVENLSQKDCRMLADNIYSFTLNVTGTNGMANAQVTAGGIDTSHFNGVTMESKKYKNLYAVGEVLDIDGDCGGYNLQWAWSSAAAAAEGIAGTYDFN